MSRKLMMNIGNTVIDLYRRYYQEHEGTFVTVSDKSENDTIDTDRYIEITEIWGNTVQDENNLADIQSVGVWNEEKQGYEVEIESSNAIIYDIKLEKGRIEGNGDIVTNNHNQFRSSDFEKVTCRNIYLNTFGKYSGQFDVYYYDENKQFIKCVSTWQKLLISIPNEAKYFKLMSRIQLPSDFDYNFTDFNLVGTSTIIESYFKKQSYKVSILLPCQLQKVGDVYDRLYWDSEKGKYVVEKNDTQLIETNITEKIQLPCYEEKTHIFVNDSVDATMKVLVPYKEKQLTPVMDGLICWLDGRDGIVGDTWIDRVSINNIN